MELKNLFAGLHAAATTMETNHGDWELTARRREMMSGRGWEFRREVKTLFGVPVDPHGETSVWRDGRRVGALDLSLKLQFARDALAVVAELEGGKARPAAVSQGDGTVLASAATQKPEL